MKLGKGKLRRLAARVLGNGHVKTDVQSFEDWGVRWNSGSGVAVHECDDQEHAEEWARTVFFDRGPEVVSRTRVVAYSPWRGVQ